MASERQQGCAQLWGDFSAPRVMVELPEQGQHQAVYILKLKEARERAACPGPVKSGGVDQGVAQSSRSHRQKHRFIARAKGRQ